LNPEKQAPAAVTPKEGNTELKKAA
jgi:hypothetical protein